MFFLCAVMLRFKNHCVIDISVLPTRHLLNVTSILYLSLLAIPTTLQNLFPSLTTRSKDTTTQISLQRPDSTCYIIKDLAFLGRESCKSRNLVCRSLLRRLVFLITTLDFNYVLTDNTKLDDTLAEFETPIILYSTIDSDGYGEYPTSRNLPCR